MKSKIFMYLFFFAVLFILFQYMNEKSIYESQEKQITKLTTQLDKANAINDSLNNRVADLNYFTLLGNDNAMTYFEQKGFEAFDVEKFVADALYEQNGKPEGNPLIPYEGLNGTMRINKLKFLNHRWILADFTDGTYWGEMVLEYFIEDDKKVDVQPISSILYAN